MSVIANTTVISNFASIGQLGLLQRLFGAVYLATEVYREIEDGLDEGYQFYAPVVQLVGASSGGNWLRLTSLTGEQELLIVNHLPSGLHLGEAVSFAIAQTRGWHFLTDDLAARNYATRVGITLSGSIGCLVLAVERKLCPLTAANNLLAQMIQHGFRSPVADLAPLLR
jgi:predicted nucleic acid-binding protein